MKTEEKSAVSDAITDEAAAWFQKMRGGEVSGGRRAGFADWLIRSPQHTREYLRLVELWDDLGELDPEHRIDVDALIREADCGGNVATLAGEAHRGDEVATLNQNDGTNIERTGGRRRRWPAGIAAALALAAGIVWFAGDFTDVRGTYATSLGEQRPFALADGSLIRLNTQSEIRVRLTNAERHIDLVRGEAMFDVASDAERPFVVADSNVVARALGTRFNVYRREQGTRVTVIEGRVAVSARTAPSDDPGGGTPVTVVPRVELSSGEQAEARAGTKALTTSRVELERVVAWTTRRLVFEADALGDVIEQFNRYNHTELRLADPVLAGIEISGVFNADDPRSLVEVLHSLAGIDAAERPDGSLLLSRPAGERAE